ncbi:MAG TPA: CoA transferase [Stellaceae bacterium]|nr:CoA transferase [Stellaceae bacterium]
MSETPAGALAGLRVIDLTRVLGGPYCTQMLADHGADVIKIEPPQGDETRGWGPPFQGDAASYFIGVNRNKRGVAMDLSRPEAREVLFRLLEDADVLVENFKTGTLERWGMGYAVFEQRFPRLIHCRVSGFGADGPLGGMPGYDAVIQGMAGLMSVNGSPDGPGVRMGVPMVDLATGMNAAIGILMALVERGRSSRGQFVEASLFDSAIALQHPHLANFFLNGKTPRRTGNAHPNICPYDAFETATKSIFLAVGNDGQFKRFCQIIGLDDLPGDARFLTNGDRVRNQLALRDLLRPVLAEQDGVALSARLIAEGVPCGPVLDIADVVEHPHTKHREMVVTSGDYRGFGAPVKLSRTPASIRSTPPAFGSSTRAVLAAAGYDPDAIETLIATGVALDRKPG